MKYRVTVQKVLEFDEGRMLELPSQEPSRHNQEVAVQLVGGKRCVMRYNECFNVEPNFPLANLRVGDVIYSLDGCYDELVDGEVVAVEKVPG